MGQPVRALLLALVATGIVTACTNGADPITASDDLVAAADEACPAQLPHTGEPTGKPLDREGFGCFGACGPSCNAECTAEDVTVTRTLAPAADGTPRCQTCTYKLTSCKSHAFCRWHDDCYRQCDLRWDAQSAAAPPTSPWNPCYLTCDNVVAHSSLVCGADWSQLGADVPSVSDACWDGSLSAFSSLTAQHVSATQCGPTRDARPRPFASSHAAWASTATPPGAPPEGYSCTFDTDCPDRNQRCDIFAGSIWSVNGPGLCVERHPSPGIDVTPMLPPGTWKQGEALAAGEACAVGWECRSGVCESGACKAR